MKVSTFGGSGFIGSHLHKALLHKGYGLRAYSRSKREGYQQWNYDVLPTNHELAIYLSSEANRTGTKSSDLNSLDIKLAGLATLVRASKYFVFLSSCAVYGYDSYEPHCTTEKLTPSEPYSVDKLACESVVLENGGLVLRISNVFGHYYQYRGTITEDLRAQCLAQNVTELSLRSYDAVLNFIDVDSVVELILKSLITRSCGIFNVASGQSMALLDLLHLASLTSGKPMTCAVPKEVSPRLVQLLDISNSLVEFDWRPSSPTCMLRTYFSRPI